MDLGLGQVAVLALVGGVAGFINVLAGGGSLLALPTLIFLGLDGSVANGTNRVALLVQNAVSVVSFFRKGYSHLKLSLTLTLCALPGAVIGALMGTRFEGIWFNRTLACIMIVLMVVMARGKVGQTATANQAVSRARLLTVHAAMLLVGFYGGFIQAGVGFMIIAILHRGLRLDLVHVNMHKVFIVGIYTIVALIIYCAQEKIHWGAGFALAIGNGLGGWIGTHTSIRKGDPLIRNVLYVALVAMAVKLLL